MIRVGHLAAAETHEVSPDGSAYSGIVGHPEASSAGFTRHGQDVGQLCAVGAVRGMLTAIGTLKHAVILLRHSATA